MNNEEREKIKELLIIGIKELGEIAECIVKDDKSRHWKEELGDLSGLCIKPMLELTGMSFEYAVELGIVRKRKKLEKLESEDKCETKTIRM